MSIEAAIAENTAALKEVAELLRVSNAGREAAVAKIEAVAAGGDAPAAARRGRTPKNADTPADPPKEAAPAAPKVATEADLRKAAEVFMTTDDDTKKLRRGFIKSVIDHFGLNPDPEKPGFIGAVPPEHYGAAIEWLKIKAANIESPISFPEKDVPADEEEEDFEMG